MENGRCLLRKEFLIELREVTNPTDFKLMFSEDWAEFFKEIKAFVSIEVLGIEKEKYEICGSIENSEYLIEINYAENISISSMNQLRILIEINSYFLFLNPKYIMQSE